ncbi:MAG TPA: hypothetical protein PLQ41_08835, partial [bacterium]|nr:hypothetical protein [bacterium]
MSVLFSSVFVLSPHSAEPLRIDFKKFFVTKSWPIVSKGFSDGSITLENEIFVKRPPSLRIDSSRTSERIASVSFYLIRNDFEMFRGKKVAFQAKIKRIAGTEKPCLQVRFRHFDGKNYQYLFGTSQTFDISGSDWTDVSLTCDILPRENVNAADFQIYVNNTPTPTVIVIDECALVEIPADSKFSSEGGQLQLKTDQQSASFFLKSLTEQDTSPLEIVKDGKPIAVIVTAPSPTKIVQYAVKELNEHLSLATGSSLPVVRDAENISGPSIHIGATRLAAQFGLSPEILPPDTWVIRRIGKSLIISGGDNNLDIHPVGKD